jgi:hypothetical protein
VLRSLITLLSLGSLCLCLTAARAATVSVSSKSIAGTTPNSLIYTHSIRLTGEIVPGDSEKLFKILTKLKGIGIGVAGGPLATIELNSPGGSLVEGLNIGRLLKKFEVATEVRKGEQCLSSCALAFLGGTTGHVTPGTSPSRSLEIGGQLGFHGFYFDPHEVGSSISGNVASSLLQGIDAGRIVSAVVIAYASEMGVDSGFVAKMLPLKQSELVFIQTPADFLSLGIQPKGLSRPPISMAAMATNVCNHSIDWRRPAPASGARALSAPEARRHILREIFGTLRGEHGPVAERIKAIVDSGDDQAIELLFGDLGRGGVPFPRLWGPTFLVTGFRYGAGFYVAECMVSVSFSNPDSESFDVALLGPAGIEKAYRFAPPNFERLFLYGRDDLINR